MNILLTSVGRRRYLVEYFKKALGDDGRVHVMNSSELCPAFTAADVAVVSPFIYDDNYISFLLKYCKENRIDALLSCFDIDLCILAKHKEYFKKIGTTVIVADYDIDIICEDKWKTSVFLEDYGFQSPKTYINLDKALNDLNEGIIQYPVIIKPRWGMGSISIYEADDSEELKLLCNKAKKNIMKTYLKYESSQNIEEAVIIQEKIIGQEYGLDIINDLNGNYVNTCVKKKYAMRSGETDCAITVDNKELRILGEKISKITKHPGNMDVDVFEKDNVYYVLEMNARFGGGYPFTHLAGVDEPKAIIKWLKGEDVDFSLVNPRFGVMGQKDISIIELPVIMENSNEHR